MTQGIDHCYSLKPTFLHVTTVKTKPPSLIKLQIVAVIQKQKQKKKQDILSHSISTHRRVLENLDEISRAETCPERTEMLRDKKWEE